MAPGRPGVERARADNDNCWPVGAGTLLSWSLEPLNATILDAILRHKLRLLASRGSDGFGSICR
jgi:hypothetical protein